MYGSIPISSFLRALALASLLSLTAAAQEGVLRDLHARGYAAFTYNRDSTGNSAGQGTGEEISTDLQGAIINPAFISLSSSFSFGHSSTSLNGSAMGDSNTYAGSAIAMVLPASIYPLVISYQRTRVGIGQAGLTNTTNTDRLSFDWRLSLARLPKLAVRYSKDSSWSDVPVASFSTTASRNSGLSISASDSFKGWDWSAGWMRSNSATAVLLLETPSEFEQTYSILGANVLKRYSKDRGLFIYTISRTASDTQNGFLSALNGTQFSQSASTSFRFTPKLNASGLFQYYKYSSQGQVVSPSDRNQVTYIVTYPGSGYLGNGSVSYQVHPRISLSDSTSYSAADMAPSRQEQATKFLTNSPAIATNYTWHRIRLAASYSLDYTRTGTNFDRWLVGLSNGGSLSASWSHPWVSLSGGFGVGHGTSGVLPGSYTDSTMYTFNAESEKLRRVGSLRFRWQMNDRTLLGSTGFLQSRRTAWSLSLIRKRFQVEGGASEGSGAHQAFSAPALIYQPLPDLIGVPLLNDNSQNRFVTASGMVRHNLRLRGTWRTVSNELIAARGTASYSLYEVYADYRIGRITIEASYGHYANISETLSSHFGSSSDRFRFRIVRTFNLF